MLAVLDYELISVSGEPSAVPDVIERMFRYRTHDGDPRRYRNNVAFLAADTRYAEDMKARARKKLALASVRAHRMSDLADHQKARLQEEETRAGQDLAIAVQQCYRHLFFPSGNRMTGAPDDLDLAYTTVDLPNTAERPGMGQEPVRRALEAHQKLADPRREPPLPKYVRDRTPLRTRGEITTAMLRDEFRRSPKPILLEDTPLMQCIRKGIEAGLFVYREDKQVWGPSESLPGIRFDESCFVHTMEDARAKDLWPRAEPLRIQLSASATQVEPGTSVELRVEVTGGREPYVYASNVPELQRSQTAQTVYAATVTVQESTT
jgi:hypothetical protein